MCDIISIGPKVNIPRDMLDNVVWNNPHGYGLLIQKKDGLELIRELPDGGTEPDVIDKLMRDNDEYHRFLHLRWKTEGALSLENVHPFKVYDQNGIEVYFMHNGTLYEYKPQVYDSRSDSLIFAETILKPLLADTGGIYDTEFIRKVISKFWGYNSNSKGLIVSNNQSPLFINLSDWKIMEAKDENDQDIRFYSSNDDYFKTLKRGYEFDRREVKAKEEEAKRLAENAERPVIPKVSDWPITPLKNISFKPVTSLTEDLVNLMEDFDLYTERGLALLDNLTKIELYDMTLKYPDETADLLAYLTSEFNRLVGEKIVLEEKHSKASKLIATQKERLSKLEDKLEPAPVG